MAGAGKVLAVLGAVVAAAVAAGIWLVMSESSSVAPDDAGGGAVAPETAKPDPDAASRKPGRKRVAAAGTSAVTGTVKRRQDGAPAAGQVVALAREGAEPWTAQADAAGTFTLADLPDGGPYELRVEAKGCGTIRLPGLVLTRGETLDVGALWLDLAVQVTVSVRTWADTPIEGAEVEAYAAPDWKGGYDWSKAQALLMATPVPVAKAVTGTDGRAVFPEMASGVWTFTARKDGLAKDGRSNVRFEGGAEPPEVKIYLTTGHTLKGRVLDGDKRPIAGASVLGGRGNTNAWDLGAAPLRSRTQSDPEGRYELTGLPTGDIALQVGLAGSAPYQVATVRVPAVSQYDVIVRSGGSLRGTVTDSGSGKPIEGATVRAASYGNTGQRFAEATTDAEGKYAIAAVAEGAVNDVSVTKEGWLQDRSGDSPMGGQMQINQGDLVTRDLKMKQGAKVSGTVTGGGAPLAGARVVLWTGTAERGVQQSKSVVTDAAGKYELSPVERGKGMLQVTVDGYIQKGLPENWWNAFQQGTVPPQYTVEIPAAGEAKLDVALDAGARVEGKVEGPDGPVAGATVTLYGNTGQQNAKSAADGTFVLTGATPGRSVTLRAQKEGYVAKASDPVQVLADEPTTGVVLTLAAQRTIRGTATSSSGQPLRDAQVSLVMKQAGGMGGRGGQFPMMDGSFGMPGGAGTAPVREDGTFEIAVPWLEGSVAVRAVALDHAAGESAPVELVESRTEYEANVVLEAGYAIRGRVVSKGVAIPGADVTLAPGRPGGRGRMQPAYYGNGMAYGGAAGTVVAVTDAEGAFTLEHVAAGTYSVGASADGYVSSADPEVKVPTAGDVTIDLDASLEITGKVVFTDGKPAAGAIVAAQKDDPNNKNQNFGWWGGGPQGISGADGAFRIRGLSPGGWKLVARAPWDGSVNFKNTVTEPVTAGTVDYKLVVQAGGTISGAVVDPAKKPVAGAWVYANPTTPSQDSGNEWHAARTKEDGSFVLASLADGPYTVTANPPQFGDGSNLLVGTAENVAVGRNDLEIALGEGLSIEGTVVDGQGKPLASAMLQIQGKPDAQGRRPSVNGNRQQVQSDADGKFRFVGLGAGKFTIHLQAWQGSRYEGMLLVGNDDIPSGSSGVQLMATTGEKIGGIVVDEAGQAIANAWVNVNVQNGSGRNGRTDKDGKFEISGLPHGVVSVHVNAPGRPPATAEKVDTGTLVLRIVCPKGGQITGRILDGAGNAYANQGIQLKRTEGNARSWAQTGSDGRFKTQLIAEGDWEFTVLRKSADGKQEWVKAGTARTGEDVELRIP